MKAIIPIDPSDPEGSVASVGGEHFEVVAGRGEIVFVWFYSMPPVDWFEDFELMYGELQADSETVKVLRKASNEEIVKYRIPLWIQSEQIPECCGKPMYFVGQLDDADLCDEAPPGAEVWWHDRASFYVFTCPHCLGVKALGQQF